MNTRPQSIQHDQLLDTALHGVAIYNPALWSRQELRDHFVARHAKLERILDDLRREQPGSLPQHRLILGQRGMGKTTLLRRIAVGILDDATLSAQWMPLTFPEEQYNIANLADFWLNCLDALGDALEEAGRADQAEALDELIAALPKRQPEAALEALIAQSHQLERRFLLLIDNVDLVFDRLNEEHWALREVLQKQPELALYGASARAVEASYQYDKAFYDFFKVDELGPLNIDEMHAMLSRLAELGQQPQVAEMVRHEPARIKTLHTLTGGNPRTVALLYGVLANGLDGDVRSDLEGLLDRVTPLYKARFEELPEQSQRLVDALAVHWDPITAKALSETLGWKVNLVSAQLTRLEQSGVLEKAPPQGKRAAFQIAERFFNIWYLMRTSRRVRRKLVWLARFLKMFFAAEALQSHARSLLQNDDKVCERDAEYRFALAQAIEPPGLRGALETQALYGLVHNLDTRERLGQLLDLQGEDAALKPRAEHMRELAALREQIDAALPNDLEPERRESLIRRYVVAKKFLRVDGLLSLPGLGTDLDAWETGLDGALELFKYGFGPELWPIVLDMLSHGDVLHLADEEGIQSAMERLGRLGLRATPLFLEAIFNDPDVSESDVRELLVLEPTFTAGWQLLASCLIKSQRYVEAEKAYRKAIQIESRYAPLWKDLSRLLFRYLQRQEEAVAVMQEGMKHCPENIYLLIESAYFLYETGNFLTDAAIAAVKTVELAPEIHLSHHIYAIIQLALKNWHEAKAGILTWCNFASDQEQYWPTTLELFREVIYSGFTEQALTLLNEAGLVDRMRPLYEALSALAAEAKGDNHYLDKLAPEVRETAAKIVEELREPPLRIRGKKLLDQ